MGEQKSDKFNDNTAFKGCRRRSICISKGLPINDSNQNKGLPSDDSNQNKGLPNNDSNQTKAYQVMTLSKTTSLLKC